MLFQGLKRGNIANIARFARTRQSVERYSIVINLTDNSYDLPIAEGPGYFFDSKGIKLMVSSQCPENPFGFKTEDLQTGVIMWLLFLSSLWTTALIQNEKRPRRLSGAACGQSTGQLEEQLGGELHLACAVKAVI